MHRPPPLGWAESGAGVDAELVVDANKVGLQCLWADEQRLGHVGHERGGDDLGADGCRVDPVNLSLQRLQGRPMVTRVSSSNPRVVIGHSMSMFAPHRLLAASAAVTSSQVCSTRST